MHPLHWQLNFLQASLFFLLLDVHSRFFITWAVAAAHAMAEHVAVVPLEHIRQQRLLASCFDKWKAVLARVVQQQRKGGQQRRPTGQGATRWRRRKATWKCWAQRMDSVERVRGEAPGGGFQTTHHLHGTFIRGATPGDIPRGVTRTGGPQKCNFTIVWKTPSCHIPV